MSSVTQSWSITFASSTFTVVLPTQSIAYNNATFLTEVLKNLPTLFYLGNPETLTLLDCTKCTTFSASTAMSCITQIAAALIAGGGGSSGPTVLADSIVPYTPGNTAISLGNTSSTVTVSGDIIAQYIDPPGNTMYFGYNTGSTTNIFQFFGSLACNSGLRTDTLRAFSSVNGPVSAPNGLTTGSINNGSSGITVGSTSSAVTIPSSLTVPSITNGIKNMTIGGGSPAYVAFPGIIRCDTLQVYSSSILSLGSSSVPSSALGGLVLPTSGGTPSTLNYYEEFSATNATLTSSSTTAASGITYNVTRCGRLVTVWMPKITMSGMGSNNFVEFALSGFPSRFITSGSTFQMIIPGWFGTSTSVANTLLGVSMNGGNLVIRASPYEQNAYWPSDGGIYAAQFSYMLPLQ